MQYIILKNELISWELGSFNQNNRFSDCPHPQIAVSYLKSYCDNLPVDYLNTIEILGRKYLGLFKLWILLRNPYVHTYIERDRVFIKFHINMTTAQSTMRKNWTRLDQLNTNFYEWDNFYLWKIFVSLQKCFYNSEYYQKTRRHLKELL